MNKTKKNRKTKQKGTRKRGGGVWNNLKKKYNIFTKDPVNTKRTGRETDLVLLLSLFNTEEWRMVKKNLLAMSTKPIMTINETDDIYNRAQKANLQF